MSEQLGLSISLLSGVEQERRKPFNSDKINLFCKKLNPSNADKARMHDLAAKARGEMPVLQTRKIGDGLSGNWRGNEADRMIAFQYSRMNALTKTPILPDIEIESIVEKLLFDY